MTTRNRTKRQPASRQYEDGSLCEGHALAFDMPAGTYAPCRAPHEQADDEPVECDACSVAIMKAAGVL